MLNFSKVDDRLWRGGHPNKVDASFLFANGVRTVINLEWEQSDDAAFDGLGVSLIREIDFEPLPWLAALIPSFEDHHIIKVLSAIRKASPVVFLHCRSGLNRTGVAVAAYRLIERCENLSDVLEDFYSYRGFWTWGDAFYIRSVARRRDALFARI